MNRDKSFGRYSIIIVGFLLVLMLFVAPEKHTWAEEDPEYRGVTNREIRVRTGPGTEYDQVVLDGKLLDLPPQTECLIIGQDTASNGKDWYKIIYVHDGEEIEGFVFAEYVAKYEISPTPLPTATPEPTATPTPTSTPIPTPTQAPVIEEKEEKSGVAPVIIGASAVVLIGVGAFVYLKFFRKKTGEPTEKEEKKTPNSCSKEVDRLKKLKLEESLIKNGHRQINIKKSTIKAEDSADTNDSADAKTEDEESKASEDKAADKKASDSKAADTDVLANAAKGTKAKLSLREEVEKLAEGDVIIHKIFGAGEVFDNTDVKLVEVHFGMDIRYLNKDSIVTKQLLELNDDGTLKRG